MEQEVNGVGMNLSRESDSGARLLALFSMRPDREGERERMTEAKRVGTNLVMRRENPPWPAGVLLRFCSTRAKNIK